MISDVMISWSTRMKLIRWLHLLSGRRSTRFRPLFDATRLSHLEGRLEVVRDRKGGLHLYAEHDIDLFTALGFVQGSERGSVLDLLRHAAQGRLREWLAGGRLSALTGGLSGESWHEWDNYLRPLCFAESARYDLERMPSPARQSLEAFARGVNDAWRTDVGSPEHWLLPARPAWRAEDCLLCIQCCAWLVSLPSALANALAFRQGLDEMGDALARLLCPNLDDPILHRRDGWGDLAAVSASLTRALPMTEHAWTAGGVKTAIGKSLWDDDLPFPLSVPHFWQQVHLSCPQFNVQGGVYPGFPGFGFGHNTVGAWAVSATPEPLRQTTIDHAAYWQGHLQCMAALTQADFEAAFALMEAGSIALPSHLITDFAKPAETGLQGRSFTSALWSADEVPEVVERVIVRGEDLHEFRQRK